MYIYTQPISVCQHIIDFWIDASSKYKNIGCPFGDIQLPPNIIPRGMLLEKHDNYDYDYEIETFEKKY